jgi:origin recognition complex subunit 6
LCKELDKQKIGPTVIAGMETIVAPHGRRTNDQWVLANMAALLGSIFLYVWVSVTMPDGVDESRYAQARKEVVETLMRARDSVSIKNLEEDEAWEGWRDFSAGGIDTAALKVNQSGWLESDWAKGIEDLIYRDGLEVSEGLKHDNADETATQVRRADTMFQERYNFLSERRRKEYATWKEEILRRIKESGEQPDAMEVDS